MLLTWEQFPHWGQVHDFLTLKQQRKNINFKKGQHNNQNMLYARDKTEQKNICKSISKMNYFWLGKLIGFGTATFPRTVMPPLLAEAHLQKF